MVEGEENTEQANTTGTGPNDEQTPPPAAKKVLVKKAPQQVTQPMQVKKPVPENPWTTVVLGETAVGKTFCNLHMEIPIYLADKPAIGKKGRKVIIYDVNNDYEGIRTLKPSDAAIRQFVTQQKVEARRIIGRDEQGRPLSKEQNYDNVKLILDNFINGMMIFDDIDRYAVHSQKQDLVSILMGNRHNGCHVIMGHQSWRKMSVTECENLTWIRLHHASDNPESMPAEKLVNFEFSLIKIASLIVEEQYELVNQMYHEGKFKTEKQYFAHRSFSVYIHKRKKLIKGCSEPAFYRAAYKYMFLYPSAVNNELKEMIFYSRLPAASTLKNNDVLTAVKTSLYAKYKRYLVK